MSPINPIVALSIVLLTVVVTGLGEQIDPQPNPPPWDTDHVFVLDPAESGTCQALVDRLHQEMGGRNENSPNNCQRGQFSSSRYAVLLRPGFHDCFVRVGFYTTFLGLGRSPLDTETRGIECMDTCGNALDNFWRGVENFNTGRGAHTQWHVSQAAPMRRMNIAGDITLGWGWSSGGYMSNTNVQGHVNAGSQQQWFNRNNDFHGGWSAGAWSFVHLGCTGAPQSRCGGTFDQYLLSPAAHTNLGKTPVIAEKPYIVINEDGTYSLIVPDYERNKKGHEWQGPSKEIPFEQVYVASEKDSAAEINQKLEDEVDYVVLQPGNYYLDEPIRLHKPFQVLLGIGLPTLKSLHGNSCVEVANVQGVRVAGFLIEPASNEPGDHLLRWGTRTWYSSWFGHLQSNMERYPGVLSDIFCRVGGATNSTVEQRQIDTMVQINSDYVIIDHTWLWRADHDLAGSVKDSRNYCGHGLEVNGRYVKAYGLFVEHTLNNLLQWNGEDGEVYFYQSELPYDVDQQNFPDQGYTSYYVNKNVRRHTAYGVGVYTFFRDHVVHMDTGIKTSWSSQIKVTNPFTKMLTGYGGLDHVFNDEGDPAYEQGISYLCGEMLAIPAKLSSLVKNGFASARLH